MSTVTGGIVNSIELFTEVCLIVMTSDMLLLPIRLTEFRSHASTRQSTAGFFF